MILKGYKKEIFRADCNPSFESVHCIAHLDQDIRDVLPYLNSVLGGFSYVDDPPSVTFKVQGRLIAVHADKIAVNALKDEDEAEKILSWLKEEINDAWKNRSEIQPSNKGAQQPGVMKILKLLPKTNCGRCNQPTCMVFAVRLSEGVKSPESCPELNDVKLSQLKDYLGEFQFPDHI